MSTERITAAELERSKRARAIARNWLQAEETRMKLSGLDPELEGDGTPGGPMRPGKPGRSPLDRVREARVSGLEIREFEKGIGDENNPSKSSQVSASELLREKALIVRALAPNHSPEDIEKYLQRVSPYLDTIAMAGNDPMAQSLLFARLMGNGSQSNSLGLKDIVETLKLVDDMRGQRQQSQLDVNQLVAGMGTMFTAGVNAAKNNGSDPMSAFNAAIQFITPVMDRQTETVKAAFENQLASLRQELSEKDPSSFFEQMKDFAETMGWRPSGSSDPEVLQRQLEMQDKSDQRAFDLSKAKWEKEWEMKLETNKQKAQAELLGGITSTLTKAFESPVVRELGRSVGNRLGTKNPLAPLAEAQTKAAVEQLANPMQTPWSFKCPKCKKDNTFTTAELTKIESAGGRWVCSCGEPYQLGSLGSNARGP